MNFIRKIKKSLTQNVELHKQNIDFNRKLLAQSEEILWAEIYQYSIRGKKELENLGLNIGRWAGNYSFFYVLYRILNSCRPNTILELGLGESSKFISTYINSYQPNTKYIVIEHSLDWKNNFLKEFRLSQKIKNHNIAFRTNRHKGLYD